MQKFYTLILAFVTAMSASAAMGSHTKSFDKMPVNAVKVENWQANSSKTIKKHHKALSKAPLKTVDASQAIFEPEGTAVNYSVTSTRFELIWGSLVVTYGDYPSQVVFGEDNKVYIRDIVTAAPSGVFVEGTRDGDKITVKFPQICYSYSEIYEGEMYTEEYFVSKMKYYTYQKDGTTYMGYRNVPDEENYVVYNISEDGTIQLDLNHGDPTNTNSATPYIIGMCSDPTPGIDDWIGYGELYQTFTPFNDEPNVLPEGVEFETWGMTSTDVNGYVQVGIDDEHVYITDIGEYFTDAVLIGKIEGDKVVFETPQFLGEFYGYFAWLVGCQWENTDWEEYEILDRIVLNYDADNKIISTDNELIDFVFSGSPDDVDALDYISNPTFRYMSEEDINAAPEDPYVVYFDHYDYRDFLDDSEGYIEWIIPNVNVKGCLLDTENMYYNFYIDGEIMTFTTDMYEMLDEDLTDIPYNFEDGWTVQLLDEDHFISFKWENYKNFGLQSFYIGSDGETYASNLVTYTPDTSGVSSINGKSLQKAEFYDLQGRPVANPRTGGIYIMRSTFSDGSTTVTKVLKKSAN